MKVEKHVPKIIAVMERRAPDGLLDIDSLRSVRVTNEHDAVEATDKEFISYMAERLTASLVERRLGFRLLLLAAAETMMVAAGAP